MCKIFSAICQEHNSCGGDGLECYGQYSCAPGSGCWATSSVPVYLPEDEGRPVGLVRTRDLPKLRLGLEAQLPHDPPNPES